MADDLPPGYAPAPPSSRGADELPPGYEPETRGIWTTATGRLSQMLAEGATFPFQAIHQAAEATRARREAGQDVSAIPGFGLAEAIDPYIPKQFYSGGWLDQPAPQTTGEKIAHGVATGVGSVLAPEAGLVSAGPRLALPSARVAARLAESKGLETPGVVSRTVRDIGERYATKPGVALTTGLAAGGVSGAASEVAEPLGPGFQVAAGALAPATMLAPAAFGEKALQAAEFASSRMGVPTLTPSASIAGWEARGGWWRKAITSPFDTARQGGRELNDLILAPRETLNRWDQNAQGILRRIGLPMSADVPPTATLTVEQQETRARALQLLANQLMRAGQTPDDVATVFNNFAEWRRLHSSGLAQNTLFLADFPAYTPLAGAIARTTPTPLPLEAVTSRQTGITPMTTTAERMAELGLPTRPRFAQPLTGAQAEERLGRRFDTNLRSPVPMGQQEVMEDALRRALLIESQPHHGHQVTGLRTIERMAADRELASGPAYDKAYAASIYPNTGWEVDFRPAVQPVLDAYKQSIEQEPGPVADAIAKGIAYFERALNAPEMPPTNLPAGLTLPRRAMLERLDRAKRVFDETVINPLYSKPGETAPWSAGVVNKFKHDVLNAIDGEQTNNVGPLYKAAREEWSSRSETIDDIKLGMDAWKSDSHIGADVMRGANPNVRLGLYEGFRLQSLKMGGTGTDVAKLFDNKRIMAILVEAIPKSEKGGAVFANRPVRFGGYVNMQQAQTRTLTEIARGSPTAARTQAMQDLADMHTVVEAARKAGFRGFMSEIGYAALNKMFGYRANTSEAIARMLFTADEATNRATIEGIRQYMGPDRFSYFTRMMAQMMDEGRIYRGAVPAGAVATQQPENPP